MKFNRINQNTNQSNSIIMLKKITFGLVILSGLFLMSCDPDNTNGNDTNKNYWERSAWTHLQLKGKVKSVKEVTDEEGSYFQTVFGENGEILETINSYKGETPSTANFEYNSAGQLIKDEYNTYAYGTHGKYVPKGTFHINKEGLVKNLAGVNDGSPLLKFEGNDLLVIWTGEREDTIVVKYTGKYPTKINDVTTPGIEWGEYMNATYQDNGMFKVFEEGFFSTGDNPYIDSRKNYYKEDKEFLLLDKIERTYTSSNSEYNGTTVTQYTYNDKKDLIKVEDLDQEGQVVSTETCEYEYDARGNWTKKTEKYSWNTEEAYVTNRVIEYFE